MESSHFLATVLSIHREAARQGLYFQTAQDERLQGRRVRIRGVDCTSYSSCSYLGLELHPALAAGVHDAVDRYGTQFSCSRGYLSAPMYAEVESALEELFEASVLVTPSTTLAHLIAIPVLADERDVIVMDHQVHHSVVLGVNQARTAGTAVELVRHERLGELPQRIRDLSRRYRTVWFATDGVFSMYGELLPPVLVRELLDIAPNVRLYVDDAHGMSWAGTHGRGSFLDLNGLDPRVVVATSFAKGFGAGGGALLLADPAERDRLRHSGGPYVFSGPMQPPMLGAVLASARLHLGPELPALQEALAARVGRANDRLAAGGIPPLAINPTPILFVPCGLPRVAFRVAETLLQRGLYVNSSVYPTVPMRRAGIRLSLTAAHSLEEVDAVVDALVDAVPRAITAEGLSRAEIDALFGRGTVAAAPRATQGVEVLERAADLPAEWDIAFAAETHCSRAALAAVEELYGRPDAAPEHRWRFRYVLVRAGGRLIGAAPITTALHKDDVLSREAVSRALEQKRRDDRYHLTSRVVMVGTNLSEGNHLHLDRTADWMPAARAILRVALDELSATGADMLMVRDLDAEDTEMERFMLREGLVRVPWLDTHVQADLGADEPTWYAALPKKKRQQLRDVLREADDYTVTVHGAGGLPIDADLAASLDAQYRSLADRKFRINIFPLPADFVAVFANCPAWELGVVRLDGAPVAWWAAHRAEDDYAPLVCGLDPDVFATREIYRAMILQILRRARAVGARRVRLGMDAELEKRRFGAVARATCVYALVNDTWGGAQLREVGADVAVARSASA